MTKRTKEYRAEYTRKYREKQKAKDPKAYARYHSDNALRYYYANREEILVKKKEKAREASAIRIEKKLAAKRDYLLNK